MKGPKTSFKMTNVVHSGWMTKSPPERKLNSPFKIFRAHWKKRYFVLCQPAGGLHDQYELHYYKDDRQGKKKGSINLEMCEQVIEALDSVVFPHMLAIKTFYKHKPRTYYLATESDRDMVTWVRWLTQVCGLRPEDQPTDIPDAKPTSPTTKGNMGSSLGPRQQVAPVRTLPATTGPQLLPDQPASIQPPIRASPALPRNGMAEKPKLLDKVDNVTFSEVPALPLKIRGPQKNGLSPVPSFYDYPPAPRPVEHLSKENLYCNSPSQSTCGNKLDNFGKGLSNDIKAIEELDHNSNFSVPADYLPLSHDAGRPTQYQDINQAAISVDIYDHPPSCESCTSSSDSDIAPERPPKGDHLQYPYINLRPSRKMNASSDLTATVPAPAPSELYLAGNRPSGYDIPQSSSPMLQRHQQRELSVVQPAPKSHAPSATQSSHVYLNTSESPGANDGSMGSDKLSSDSKERNQPPPTGQTNSQEERGPAIFSTKRTRSFKKNVNINNNSKKWSPKTTSLHIPAAPDQRPALSPRTVKKETASEDKETAHHPLSLMRSIPAPSQSGSVSSPQGELKYLDLAPPELSPDPHSHGHGANSHGHGATGHSHNHQDHGRESVTEYREIDFVKTQALSDTKREKDKERKDDRS